MNLFELTRPLRRGLAALRKRVRRLLLLLGISRTLVLLVTALALLFLADYALRLPLWVRTCILLALVAGLLVVIYRRLVRPLAHPLEDALLAGRVEAAHPELCDRLRSSLAFASAEQDPDNEDSPALMRVVVEQTLGLTARIRFRAVAHTRTAVRWAVGGLALLLLAGLAAGSQRELTRTFLRRDLLLRDVAWPRRTTLQVVGMTPAVPRRVTRGRETTIRVRAKGSVPDRVRFAYWEAGDAASRLETIDLTPSAEDPAVFVITLPVYTSYRFTVAGGDDQRKVPYRIVALAPPAILRIDLECTYPKYLERPPETLRGGDQRVPQGTRVKLRLQTSMPLAKATLAIGAAPPANLAREAPDRFTAPLLAQKDLRYSIHLVGENGEENDPGIDTFVLRVARDQAPTVRVTTPRSHIDRLPGGVVLIGFLARDDYRVDAVQVRYQLEGDLAHESILGEAGTDALHLNGGPDPSGASVLGAAMLDLARLRRDDGKPIAKEDRLTFQVAAVDSAGKKTTTRSIYRVELISRQDLSQTIQARQQDLGEAVRRGESRARDASVLLALAKQELENRTALRRGAGRLQAAQARIIDDLESIAARVEAVLNLYVFNRLDDPSAADQLLPYYERHLLRLRKDAQVPFSGALYRELWAATRKRRIRAGSAHLKLLEMADLADRLAVDRAPAAYKALGVLMKARTRAEADAAFARAAQELAAILEGYARLSGLMRQWESYEGIVRLFRTLRDTEQSLVDDLEKLQERGR